MNEFNNRIFRIKKFIISFDITSISKYLEESTNGKMFRRRKQKVLIPK